MSDPVLLKEERDELKKIIERLGEIAKTVEERSDPEYKTASLRVDQLRGSATILEQVVGK